MDSRFIARMESLLHLYGLPHDPQHPVVCFDERPCFLIGEMMAPLNPQPGQGAKERYDYTKNSYCCLLAGIEPLTRQRLAKFGSGRVESGRIRMKRDRIKPLHSRVPVVSHRGNLYVNPMDTYVVAQPRC